MTKFLGLIRLSGAEATRMLQDGPLARREFIELIVREGGGTVEELWLTNVGDWDLVCVVDMATGTAATGAAATLARRAAGLTGNERWIELAEVSDVADAVQHMSGTGISSA
jgi:uncharacterized protein with GYD domain